MKRIVIILIVSLLLSCERDKENLEPNLNANITIEPNNWWLQNGRCFYFVTTLDGELIAFMELEDNKTNTLNFDNDFRPDKYNVHRLHVPNDNDQRYLKSYFNTSQSSFTDSYFCEQLPNPIGDCKIHFSGPSFQTYIISTPSGGERHYTSNPHSFNKIISTELYQDHRFLYAFLKSDQQYYYKYLFDLNPDETYSIELDPTVMETDFDIHVLNAPEGLIFIDDCKIRNTILGESCTYTYCSLYSEISNDSTTLSIFNTPINPGKYFESQITMKLEDNKKYLFLKKGNIPEFIPLLDFDISSSNLDYENISITTTGSFDYISGYYRGENYPYKSWSFNSDNPDLIKFPDMPSEITELFPSITSSTFFDTLSIESHISLIENSEIENYTEYLSDYYYSRNQGENSTIQKLTINNFD